MMYCTLIFTIFTLVLIMSKTTDFVRHGYSLLFEKLIHIPHHLNDVEKKNSISDDV